MKKWHVYQQKHITTLAFCITKRQICPQNFEIPPHPLFLLFEFPFLQNQISLFFCFSQKKKKKKKISLSSFFSLESEFRLPQFSTQTSAMLSHAFLFTPNLHHLTMLSHHLSSLSFFILPSTVPLQYLSILGSQP